MRRRAFVVGLVLGLLALASTTEAAWAAAETQGAGSAAPVLGAIVLEVVDGDTMEVELDDGARATVRLIGIDTPESVQPGTPVECQAQAATENLNALVDGEAVTLTTDPTQDRQDRFGRLLAYVDRAGRDVGEAQIRAGFSRVYIYDNRPFQRLNAYQAAEDEAAAAQRGAWEACDGNFHMPDGDDFSVQQGSRAESQSASYAATTRSSTNTSTRRRGGF